MNNSWYDKLNKSKLTPPNYIFPIVWSFLYITIFISFFIIIYHSGFSHKKAILFFGIQMLLNLIWTPIFFKLRNIKLSLCVILFLWMLILLTIIEFLQINIYSGLLLIPYYIWVSFATYLNAYIYLYN